MSPSPFDFLKEITSGKKDIMLGTPNDKLVEKDYTQFIINKGLSYYPDCILFANEMNTKNVDNRMHFTYLLKVIRKKPRYEKWVKLEKRDDVLLIQKHYNYSYQKALSVMKLLSESQIQEIREEYIEGGTNSSNEKLKKK